MNETDCLVLNYNVLISLLSGSGATFWQVERPAEPPTPLAESAAQEG